MRSEPKPWSNRLLWPATLAFVTLLGMPTSRAAPTRSGTPDSRLPSVYLVPVQRAASNVSSLIPRRVTARLKVDLAAQQNIELLTPLGEAGGGGGQSVFRAGAKPEPDQRKAGKRFLAAGLTAYRARRWATAQRHLLAALKAFEVSAAHIENGDQLGQLFGYLGLAFLRQKKTSLAVDSIESAYAIDPTLKLERLPLPRKLKRVVLQSGRRALRRRKARITVQVVPAGAWVFLDGDEKGKAPYVIKDVLPGRHYFAARHKGHHSRSVVINVKPGSRRTITLRLPDATPRFKTGKGLAHAFLSEIQKRLSAGLVDKRIKPLASQFAKRVKADFLVLGAVSRAQQGGYLLRSYLFRRSDAKMVELDSYRFDGELLNLATGTSKMADAATNATSNFPATRDITYVSVPRLRPRDGGDGENGGLVGVVPGGERKVHSTVRPWYLRWAFWGTVIGVVMAGAVGVGGWGLYQATHRESKGYQITVSVP